MICNGLESTDGFVKTNFRQIPTISTPRPHNPDYLQRICTYDLGGGESSRGGDKRGADNGLHGDVGELFEGKGGGGTRSSRRSFHVGIGKVRMVQHARIDICGNFDFNYCFSRKYFIRDLPFQT